jgi:putative tricarboxylic transport membrane protein
MYIGNVMLLLLNLPLIGMWVKVLRVPRRILMPLILLCCLIGAYSVNDNPVDVTIMVIFGAAGYVLRKLDYELTPMLIAFVLAPLLEASFRQSLILSDGRLSIFVERPISSVILGISVLLIISSGFSSYRRTREKLQ